MWTAETFHFANSDVLLLYALLLGARLHLTYC